MKPGPFNLRVRSAHAAFLFAVFPIAASGNAADPGVEFFEKRIRPILADRCYSCHAADTKAAGGLRVDDLNGLLLGGDEGPAVKRGDAENSLLIQRINHVDAKRRMPRDSDPLTAEEVADLTKWIQDGVAWPEEKIPAYLGKDRGKYENLRKNHWAWQRLTNPATPLVKDGSWPKNAVDRFILAKLEAKDLSPVADASPGTWLRRVTFDLSGLPPSPGELDAFAADPSEEARMTVVDRLLASPSFGEQWGRHWLDVARYGESTGPSRNIPYPHAWKYRDYVIDAVNRDVPYDRFIQEQIAGDLLEAESEPEKDRLLTATGFLALGVKDVNQRFKGRFIMDNVDEQIDTVTRSTLGLTVSCARCHDHKFDPIPTTDYYSLAGIFTSTDDCAGVRNKMGGGGLDYYDPSMLVRLSSDVPPPPEEKVKELQAKLDEAKKEWDAIRGTPEGLKRNANGQPVQRAFRLKYEKLQGEFLSLTDPVAQGFAVHGVREGKVIGDTQVRIRGEAERLGPVAPRGFLTAFEVPGIRAVDGKQSGRLQLAEWITSPANPLTSRVAVNRIWAHLFGEGIVTTVDNFGVNGDVPSHPELLDYLANRIVENGWSVKALVREIVLSRAYGLGGDAPEKHINEDPVNRFVWRHSPRRMTAEEIRDSILAVSGKLRAIPPSDAAVKDLKMIEIRDNGQEAAVVHRKADEGLHRSVYLPLLRGVIPKSLEAFDPVTQTLVTGKRDATTVPTQALFMLNSSFVRSQALALAETVPAGASGKDAVGDIYKSALGRQPSDAEIERSLSFLGAYEAGYIKPEATEAHLAENRLTDSNATDAANPDDIPRDDKTSVEASVDAPDARTAAWMAFAQSLFASAEFRFIR
jgi:hypothetical protein